MADFTRRVYNLKGLNLYVNPIAKNEGELLRAVNVTSDTYGALNKRQGYSTYLGTADGSTPTTLFSWTKDDGSLFTYRASGSSLYYSIGGTGAWTLADNGTISPGAHVGYGTLNNTLIIGDGVGSTRHTTNGTAFTNTTLAPVGQYFQDYQGRMYLGGTASTLFYSVANDATNWALSGTSDSSSFQIPGPGKINSVFLCADRLNITKTSGLIKKWDGYSLVDVPTRSGPSSPYSVNQKEGFYMWMNGDGLLGYGGDRPQILSNAVQPLIYNNSGSAIAGNIFDTAPGVTHRYDYFVSIGTVTEDVTGQTVPNAVLKYDYLKNQFTTYSFHDNPTCWHSYKDATGKQQLIFGASGGQCFTFGNGATSDNGNAIEASVLMVTDGGIPELDKTWHWFWPYFNPGCQAKIAFAYENTFVKDFQRWTEIRDVSDGAVNVRIPDNARGKLLFIRIYESSKDPGFKFYGYTVNGDTSDR